uniref:Reverse transcriptase domain-containing protein n=1 Tax=Laticauda laticaudata TaxID=8630 RepID=A0A8C5RQB2_LATLA
SDLRPPRSHAVLKGTRQGCPLSLLLFVLTLEVLNRNIREERDIKWIKIKKEEFKSQAFADDLVFILEDPQETASKLIEKIEAYGKVAGLKINKEKTKILIKNILSRQKEELVELLKIQVTNKIKYLGIYLRSRCSTLKENNYIKLYQQIVLHLVKWKNLQLILYLFQKIPVRLGKDYFEDLNKIVLKYIWRGKKVRIKLKLLQDAIIRGGFGLPNWELYYQATKLMWVKEWILWNQSKAGESVTTSSCSRFGSASEVGKQTGSWGEGELVS